jgi:hypothetical protein
MLVLKPFLENLKPEKRATSKNFLPEGAAGAEAIQVELFGTIGEITSLHWESRS